MRVPLSWLREYVDTRLSAEALAETLTLGGLEVDAIHRPTAGTRGVYVAEVEAVERLAGSDKLYLVTVSDGRRGHEIVCGAANFAPGDRVPAALPGASLPGGATVQVRTLFGRSSQGMLLSPRELGVGDDHRGIWVLDRDAPLGADLAEWLDLEDPVLRLDLTPDRGYALSLLGVARDVAALTGAQLRLPEPAPPPPAADPGVPVEIADPRRCRRFDTRRVDGVRVGPSPSRLQQRLAAAGMRPISNVVDATNHTMLETGHPSHAYDLARLAGPRILVRGARPGETLVTLDGETRRLDADDLVIADAAGAVGLAGVMGGQRTEVRESTGDLLLEVACFDPAAVLGTARRHQLLTGASTRFEKTVSAETVGDAADRCAAMIAELGGGRVSGTGSNYPSPVEREVIRLSPRRARSLLGMDLSDGLQRDLLEAIGCRVQAADGQPARRAQATEDGGALLVHPPDYRPDLRLEADLCEELARLHGYDRVPETVPSSGAAGRRQPEHDARRLVRGALGGGGWSEVVAFPFIAAEDLERLGLDADDPRRHPVELVNPLSKEEAVLRTTLLPGLLRTLLHNVNRQRADLALFEVGRVFLPPTAEEPGAPGGPHGVVLPAEPLMLGLAGCGAFEPGRHDRPARDIDLYDLLGAADLARAVVGRAPLEVEAVEQLPYHPGRAARLRLEGQELGVVGELHPRIIAALQLPGRTVAGELRLDRITAGGRRTATGQAPSALPGLRFDVAVVVDDAVPAAAVEAAVRAGAGARLTVCTLFDVYRGAQLGEGRKSLAYALRLDDPQRQLTDEDEAAAIAAVEAAVGERVEGRLRR